eukprot:1136315-Pelagomonas_calceolata.AAC.4
MTTPTRQRAMSQRCSSGATMCQRRWTCFRWEYVVSGHKSTELPMGLKRSSKESSRLASQALFCLSAQLTFCLFVPFPRAARWLSEQTNC